MKLDLRKSKFLIKGFCDLFAFGFPFPIIRKKYMIVYKKTDEWYIEWQRVTTRGTTSDNEWQRVTTSGATSDKEWQGVIQRVTKSENK